MPPRATLSNKREIRVAFRLHFGALPGKPGIPRILQRTPLTELLVVLCLAPSLVLFVVPFLVLLQIFENLSLFLLGQQTWMAWPPEELEEAVTRALVEHFPLEVPHREPILHLMNR